MPLLERIPFAEAVSEKLLLKKRFEQEISLEQRTVLKIFYGMPLNAEEERMWQLFQGQVPVDELGYPLWDQQTTSIPYVPKEYVQMWAIMGRRSGKTDSIISTALAYEAVLGGHLAEVRPGQETVVYLISQTKEVGVMNLAFVRQALESSPILAKEIDRLLAEEIILKNGVTIKSAPPSLKSQRGLAIPVVAFDEVGFWYKDSDSANPDYEVERAIRWNQLQFKNAKRFGISSPWTKEGLLYRYHMAGTEGRKLHTESEKPKYAGILVVNASTAAMGNPLVTREKLESERIADEESFKRESLAEFTDSVSGFLSGNLLDQAVDVGVAERPAYPRPMEEQTPGKPDPHFVYVAAMDPAFRSDSFGFAITHYDPEKGVVVDVARRWNPTPGTKLNPEVILQEIVAVCAKYRIKMLYSDQYQLESLQQLALKYGIVIDGVDFTARSKGQIFGNFQQLVNQKRLRLLDPKGHPAAQEMYTELCQLERIARANGSVSISAPPGKHDDMACCVALAAYKCIWMRATLTQPSLEERKEKSHVERGLDTINRRRGRQDQKGPWGNWD